MVSFAIGRVLVACPRASAWVGCIGIDGCLSEDAEPRYGLFCTHTLIDDNHEYNRGQQDEYISYDGFHRLVLRTLSIEIKIVEISLL